MLVAWLSKLAKNFKIALNLGILTPSYVHRNKIVMEKNSFLTRLIAASSLAVLLFIGCKKESSNTLSTQDEEQVAGFTAESEIESQFVFDDIFNNVFGVNSDLGIGGVGIFGRTIGNGRVEDIDSIPHCVTLSITPLQPRVFPKTVVIDFGTGCTSHGHFRSGKITTVYTGRLIEPGKSATTTFENFMIDSLSIEGMQVITNATSGNANQREFKTEINNAKITKPNGAYEEWNAVRITTQIEGNGTVLPNDDVFRITGGSNGKTKRDNLLVSWASEIQEPLIKRFACRWFSKGEIKSVRNGLPSNTPWTATLDFGDGTCDNKADLIINGNSHQITLR